jgi:hypothetical protein
MHDLAYSGACDVQQLAVALNNRLQMQCSWFQRSKVVSAP